ncbi:MAG: hypothetical protein WBP45_14485, partial [Daejeonella sp.]
MRNYLFLLFPLLFLFSCKKNNTPVTPLPVPEAFSANYIKVNNLDASSALYDISQEPAIKINFPVAIDRQTINNIILNENGTTPVPYTVTYQN